MAKRSQVTAIVTYPYVDKYVIGIGRISHEILNGVEWHYYTYDYLKNDMVKLLTRVEKIFVTIQYRFVQDRIYRLRKEMED